MASIGDLVAHLGVDSSGWSKGLSGAKSQLSSFSSSSMAAIGAVTAAFAAVGLSAYGVTKSIEKTAATADQAARTGLSGQFLQRLSYAADQAGVSNESLTKSLSKMTLNIGEAVTGNATAAKSFQKLGLTVDELKGMQPEEQFAAISEAIGGIQDPAQRAAAAVDIFGKSGAELGPMFADGVEGLTASMDQATQLGIGLSDEDIAAAASADDAMSRLSATIGGVIDKVSAKLSPVWEAFSNTATATIVTITGMTEGMGDGFGWLAETAGTAFEFIATGIVTALSVGEFAFKNWQTIGEYAFVAVQLAAVSSFGEIGHFFTQTIPGYLSWFGNNWRDVFFTAFDFVTTGFINLGDNIRNAWTAIIDWITGNSDELNLVWKPLSDGFVSTIKEMPDIPDRVKSELEVKLGKELSNMGQNLGNSLTGTIAKNLEKLPSIKSALATTGPSQAATAAIESDAKSTAKHSGKVLAGFMEAGSSEAYSAIVQAMTGGADKIQQDQLSELKAINKGINKMGYAGNYAPVVESLA